VPLRHATLVDFQPESGIKVGSEALSEWASGDVRQGECWSRKSMAVTEGKLDRSDQNAGSAPLGGAVPGGHGVHSPRR
jgi:hypothetical protein